MSDPFEPAPEHDDTTAPEAAPAPAPESPAPDSEPEQPEAPAADPAPEPVSEPESDPAPEVQYAPTVVNSQAHEKIQAGERAQGVGLTVDASQR